MVEEKELVRQLLHPKTQNEAFQKLLVAYQRPLYNLIRNIVVDHDDTDDVLQDTFIKIFKNLSNFKGDSKLFTWMYRIATNEALTFLKKRAKDVRLTSEALHSRMIDNLIADPYFDGDELQIKLQKAISELPQKQQLVFRMRYFDEIKYEDMSEILDTSVGALKASYHHAYKKIEHYMKQD